MAQRSIKWCQSRLFLAKARALHRSGAGAALVFVDHSDALETKRMSALAQIVLAALAFQACAHLLHRRLTNIHVSITLRVNRLDLLAHHSPPLLFHLRLRAAND
jgi:hypothetical protein